MDVWSVHSSPPGLVTRDVWDGDSSPDGRSAPAGPGRPLQGARYASRVCECSRIDHCLASQSGSSPSFSGQLARLPLGSSFTPLLMIVRLGPTHIHTSHQCAPLPPGGAYSRAITDCRRGQVSLQTTPSTAALLVLGWD